MPDLMSHPFHSLAEVYPLMPEEELRRMADNMREHGFNPRWPIVWHEGLILDGRNRWLAARMAGVEADSVQLPPGEDPAIHVEQANEHRRHLTQEWLQRRRQERIVRVAEARRNGKSMRVIAEEERVSEKQIRDDIKCSGEKGYAPEPKVTTGKDGKTYPAKHQAPLPEPETEEDVAQEMSTPKPLPPTPPHHPHSDTLCSWLRIVMGQTFVVRVEQGGIKALLAEDDKWDWKEVKNYLLPMLSDLRDCIDEFHREIQHAASLSP